MSFYYSGASLKRQSSARMSISLKNHLKFKKRAIEIVIRELFIKVRLLYILKGKITKSQEI